MKATEKYWDHNLKCNVTMMATYGSDVLKRVADQWYNLQISASEDELSRRRFASIIKHIECCHNGMPEHIYLDKKTQIWVLDGFPLHEFSERYQIPVPVREDK